MSYKRNRSRKALSLEEAKLRITDAVHVMERIILESEDEQKQIQAVNALSGIIGKYAKLIETTDLINRVEALENEKRKDNT